MPSYLFSLAAAATRVLRQLNAEYPDQATYDSELQDAESSLIAQLQAEEFVPSDWVMYVEHDQMPETDGLVSVRCTEPAPLPSIQTVWLQINATTGEVTRL